MRNATDLVRGWLRKAQSDLTALEGSRQAGAPDAACFHAQQAAEKLLNAFLTHHGTEFPFTHNLAKLVHLCAAIDPTFTELAPTAEPLTPYAVELRYDVEFWPSPEVVAEAQNAANTIREFVLAKLPEDVTGGAS
jgi:HEPN domain-containing protein